MSEVRQSTFVITREDRAEEPKTISRQGLIIGRLSDSDIWLNHPAVSRLHAGINEVEGYFYLTNLSASSATTLNGRVIHLGEPEALTDGDELQIGPYFMRIGQTSGTLRITVVHQFALLVGERKPQHQAEADRKQLVAESRSAGSAEVTNALKVFWDKRTREKAGRPSPLHPRTPPRLGKIRFNWMPTRDLVRPWPFAIIFWALIIIGTLSGVAAVKYKNAFAPDPISAAHTRRIMSLTPAIARRADRGECTSCHVLGVRVANKEKMNANCAACHQTESFVATMTRAHRDAGITCVECHTEHRDDSERPVTAALEGCAKCHTDENRSLYDSKSVHTAHDGTHGYGYPVKDGVWIWKGLDTEELTARPRLVAYLEANRVTSSQVQEWRNAQFHGIHLNGVRVVAGIDGIDEEGTKVLSCSSCHKTGYMGSVIDRKYPSRTCKQCHNTQVFEASSGSNGSPQPSCTSCHVQHIKDTRWASSLRTVQGKVPATSEFTK